MCYIVIEYIKGRLVSDVWLNLDIEARRSVLCQLYEYIRQLQALKLDRPGPVGGGGGVSEGSFFTDYDAGPFKSRKDMEDWFNDRLLVCHDFGHASQTPPGWFAGRFDELVMCHLDIHPRNLILDGQRSCGFWTGPPPVPIRHTLRMQILFGGALVTLRRDY
jgi:hypothetical protein